jgi:hypothetical protein
VVRLPRTGQEAAYERRSRVPAYAGGKPIPYGIGGLRWHSGEWDHIVEPFLAEETEAALGPIADLINDPDTDDADLCFTGTRLGEIACSAVRHTRLPAQLRTTPDLLLWAEHLERPLAERAQVMLRTIAPERFHATFPEWVARAIHDLRADQVRMQALREYAVDMREGGYGSMPEPELLSAELHADLAVCGLWWYLLATGDEAVDLVLDVAATTSRPLPRPCPAGHPAAPALD